MMQQRLPMQMVPDSLPYQVPSQPEYFSGITQGGIVENPDFLMFGQDQV